MQKNSLFYLSFLIIHVGGTYFVNHKTKDYFPESAGLLNLPMNEYLKGIKEPWFATIFRWYTLWSRRLSL